MPLSTFESESFLTKSILYLKLYDISYSLLETIQFKSRPSTLEWTVYFQIDRWLLSVYFTSRPSNITYRLQSLVLKSTKRPLSFSNRLFEPTNFQQNSRNSRFLGNHMFGKSSKFLKIPDFQEIACLRKWQNFPKFPIFRSPDFKQTSVSIFKIACTIF